jgi:ankyrin repeat protein
LNLESESALMVAAKLGDTAMLDYLIKHPGFDPLKSDLARIVIYGILSRREILDLLMNLDFDINQIVYLPRSCCAPVPSKEGQSPSPFGKEKAASARVRGNTILGVAIWNDDLELVQTVMNHPRFDARASLRGGLFEAIRSGSLFCFVHILKSVENCSEVKNRKGESLALRACMKGRVGFLKALSEIEGFSVTREEGLRVISMCVTYRMAAAFPILAEIRGIDFNACLPRWRSGTRGGLPVVIALVSEYCRKSGSNFGAEKCFEALMTIPSVDLNIRSSSGKPLLFFLLDSVSLLDMFLQQKGRYDINIRNLQGETALIYVLLYGSRGDKVKLIEKLVDNGIDIELKDCRQDTAWGILRESWERGYRGEKPKEKWEEGPGDGSTFLEAVRMVSQRRFLRALETTNLGDTGWRACHEGSCPFTRSGERMSAAAILLK